MMRWKAALAAALLLLLAPLASAGWGMPTPLTDRGKLVEGIYAKITMIGIGVFLLVFVLLVWILVRYREGTGKGKATHEAHRGSLKAEMIWTVIPLLIMLSIGVMAYAGLVQLDEGTPLSSAEMEVKITGYQWLWQMDYGNGVKVLVSASPDADGHLTFSDVFHLPADTPTLMNLTGGDVIHAFNILDGNRAYVSMDDANPLGPHKYHTQVLTFPAGDYHIQCKEMCLNPGHGYMRANLTVEPKAQFDAWLKERTLAVGAQLVTKVHVDADATSLKAVQDTTVVKGSRVIVELQNKQSNPLDVHVPGDGNRTIAGGATDLFAFDTAVVGDFVLTGSNGGSVAFHSIEATPVQVNLGAFALDPPRLDLKAGTTYLFQVKDVHSTGHNLYVGHHGGEVKAHSPDISPGGAASFVWTAEAGNWDMWCNVAGHYDLGMHGTITVA